MPHVAGASKNSIGRREDITSGPIAPQLPSVDRTENLPEAEPDQSRYPSEGKNGNGMPFVDPNASGSWNGNI